MIYRYKGLCHNEAWRLVIKNFRIAKIDSTWQEARENDEDWKKIKERYDSSHIWKRKHEEKFGKIEELEEHYR